MFKPLDIFQLIEKSQFNIGKILFLKLVNIKVRMKNEKILACFNFLNIFKAL